MKKTMTLLGDIGGTNARFAYKHSTSGPLLHKLRCDDFKTLVEAINYYLKDIGAEDIESIFLAIACTNL